MRFITTRCIFVAAAVATPAWAETRTFPEAVCSYTLPNKDWQWIEPSSEEMAGGKTLAQARNQRGLVFTLRSRPVALLEKPNSNSYARFEAELLDEAKLTRTGSKYLTFNGVPSYQFDALGTKAPQAHRIRILYANDRLYFLRVSNSQGAIESDPDSDLAFLKFAFTETPRPMVLPHDGMDEKERAEKRGESGPWPRGFIGYGAAGLVGLVFFGAWVVLRVRDR